MPESREVSLITVANLVKEFRRPKRFDGPLGGIRTLLTRQYVSKLAVDDITFSVGEGELVGYLGPNGAGKSTTIKILTGILQPTSGTVEVAGIVPWKERQRNARNIGVVFGQRTQLWWDLPLRDSLELIGKLYGVSKARHDANTGQFIELLGLGSFLDTPVRQLSLGQRMRGDLAAAMLPGPRVLYLDEPTIGLDVVAKERIRDFIARLNREEGTTVVLTTHDLDDVERLCRRIVLIDGGKVLFDDSVEKLKARYMPCRQLVMQLADGVDWQGIDMTGVTETRVDDDASAGLIGLLFDPAFAQAADVIAAVTARHAVKDLSIVEPELEKVVHQIYAAREGIG